ncbi:hypothetical protein [Streptomyces sp. ISL-100]|uniref:hypothetical protein n=1 Tax=Streptomyces sp. ISL-100 TaxID=2819173 RepID=UPI001BEC2C7C|nr:hypothetical protein [Streptomyces sp. ISL-100]MBT2396283.1 hypothetical protein [Streptomyces sp. ISL-100]
MNTFTARLCSLRLASAGIATVTAAALLLTGCAGGDGDGTPECRTERAKSGDLVPSAAHRPCIVYGSGTPRPADGGVGVPGTAGGGTNRHQAKPKMPGAPKAPSMPKAPAVKAPAPAVKAPSLAKVR